MLKEDLFSDSRSPYYVIAPPYTEMSSGIRVLHYLCHILNMRGQEAYISTAICSDVLRTPLLTEAVKLKHKTAGREPIVIYPEVISGNPLGARYVVRYLLNRPGVLGGDEEFDKDEFILQYRREYVPEGMHVDAALYLPASDLTLFNTKGVDESKRTGACYYVNRYKGKLDQIPEGAVEVSRRVPRTLGELGKLFKTKELLYTYEPSAVALEASLCGCAVVYLPNPEMPEPPHKDLLGTEGAAWGTDPSEIRRARESVANVHQLYSEIIESFSNELHEFIERTQRWARQEKHDQATTTQQSKDQALVAALEVNRLLGTRLDKIALELVENQRVPFASSDEKEGIYLGIAQFLLCNKLTNESFQREPDREISRIEQLDNLEAAEVLLQKVIATGNGKKDASVLRSEAFCRKQNIRYENWIQAHSIQEVDAELFAERLMYQWKIKPIFHFILFLLPGDEGLLGDTLDSLGQQMYSDWRLTVIADTPAPDRLWDEIDTLQWTQCGVDDDPYSILNLAVETVESHWVAFIAPGVQFQPFTLLRLGDYVNSGKSWKVIYTDVDQLDENGLRCDPRFLPDINLDLLRSIPYCRESTYFQRQAILDMGGYEPLPGCESIDLTFKAIETWGEESVGHIADVLSHVPAGGIRAPDEAIWNLTVKNHLERCGIPAIVGDGYLPGSLRINYVHSEEASVSIIIPNRDKYEYIESCIKSLIENTSYDNYEVIITDCGSTDVDTLGFYDALEAAGSAQVSVVRMDAETSYSKACNQGARVARGQYLLFLKNHVEARQAQWLSRIMNHAQRSDVGIVGARIIYPETTYLFHAGIILGLDEVSGMPFASQLTLSGEGYMGRAQTDQNYSAVSGACLAIRAEIFDEIGGMDIDAFDKHFTDVDLCLRVGEAGYKVVWTPYSILMAYKGVAAIVDRDGGEGILQESIEISEARKAMLQRWLPKLAHDPAYNPNLELSQTNVFLVDDKLPQNWDIHFHERNRVLGLPLKGGSGEYRVIHPFKAISKAALQQTEYYPVSKNTARNLNLTTIARMEPDTIVIQAAIDDLQIGLLEDIVAFKPDIFRVFTLDDLVTDIPEKSSVYKTHIRHFRNSRARIRKALSLCNRMVVTTRPLADAYKDLIEDIRVIPNRLQRDIWTHLESSRRAGVKPRIGWVGAQQHQGDLALIVDVVKKTADDLDWVFMGMCPEEVRGNIKEYHSEWLSFDKYPEKMASLNLDIAVAPLEVNAFNEAKSNLRLLEYGILGWPVICTDIAPYQAYNAPVKRVENDTDAWVDAIMEYANDLDKAAKEGDRLRNWVKKHFILEDHLDEWVDAFTPVGSKIATSARQAGKIYYG